MFIQLAINKGVKIVICQEDVFSNFICQKILIIIESFKTKR